MSFCPASAVTCPARFLHGGKALFLFTLINEKIRGQFASKRCGKREAILIFHQICASIFWLRMRIDKAEDSYPQFAPKIVVSVLDDITIFIDDETVMAGR